MGAQEMAKVAFTQNIQRHVTCREAEAEGHSVREVLDHLFAGNPRARNYVLDDQSALRKHMIIFVDGEVIRDRVHLSDPVTDTSDVYVFQALSGG
jgi:molybdopterin converting factor small subunit